MAKDDLVGNMPTENLVQFASENGIETAIDQVKLVEAMQMASKIMG